MQEVQKNVTPSRRKRARFSLLLLKTPPQLRESGAEIPVKIVLEPVKPSA